MQEPRKVELVVYTGGPSGGKSTCLAVARQWLENFGYRVVVLAETATELMLAGFSPDPGQWRDLYGFQYNLFQYMRSRETRYMNMLKGLDTDKPCVVLCDRGLLDARAYMGPKPFGQMLGEHGTDIHEVLGRYKAVIHLVTAADGAEKFYTLENNAARTEAPDEALALDKRTYAAWQGHPHHIIIDNSTDFETKKRRALQALARVLHMPEPLETERKFRVDNFSTGMIPPDAQAIEITQDYLTSTNLGVERRVRSRTLNGSIGYYYTEKQPTYVSGQRIERDRSISPDVYQALLREKDPDRATVCKTRHVFEFGKHTFELDVYQGDAAGLVVLEVELQDLSEKVDLPDGWQLIDVTHDTTYSNSMIALLLKQGVIAKLTQHPAPQA